MSDTDKPKKKKQKYTVKLFEVIYIYWLSNGEGGRVPVWDMSSTATLEEESLGMLLPEVEIFISPMKIADYSQKSAYFSL